MRRLTCGARSSAPCPWTGRSFRSGSRTWRRPAPWNTASAARTGSTPLPCPSSHTSPRWSRRCAPCWARPPARRRVSRRQQEPAERVSIAVLPFNNMSGDAEQEYFSDGITEDIITDLSKVSGLFVVARNTVFTYKGKAVKVQDVCRELDVKFVLEGSVRKAGAKVRVNGQLINGETGGHVWADRYDRDLTDIFAIQDEITHAIVEQLKVKLLPQERQVDRAGADGQHRGVHVLPARPAVLSPALQVVLPAGAAHVRQGGGTRSRCTHAPTRASRTATPSCSSTITSISRSTRSWPPAPRRLRSTPGSPKRMRREGSRCRWSRNTTRPCPSSSARSRSIRTCSRHTTSWREPASPRTRWTRRPRSSSARPN